MRIKELRIFSPRIAGGIPQQVDKAMIIGSAKIIIHIPNSRSLKLKRQVVKSIISRVRNQFNASIAEVDSLDLWQTCTLGVACINTDASQANKTLDRIVNLIEATLTEGHLVDYQIEIL